MPGSRRKRHPLLTVFGERVRARRLELGFSQEGLAHAAELHRTYIGGVERGERNLSLVNVVKIGHALGLDPGDLLRDL